MVVLLEVGHKVKFVIRVGITIGTVQARNKAIWKDEAPSPLNYTRALILSKLWEKKYNGYLPKERSDRAEMG